MRWDWQKLVTPRTPKATVAELKAKAADLIAKRQEANAVSKTVAPIDWEFWSKEINTPGVVDNIRKEYEALKFAGPAVDPEIQKVIDKTESTIVKSAAEARLAAFEVEQSDKVIAKLETIKVEGFKYAADQWTEVMPFMEEQIEQDKENLDWVYDEGERELLDVDMKSVKEQVLAGIKPQLLNEINPVKLGHYNQAEEEKLKAEGRWSIARTFASMEERVEIQKKVDTLLAGGKA